MKNIAIIVPSLNHAGGAEKTAAMLANALAEEDNNVCIYVMSSEPCAFQLNKKVKCVLLDSDYQKKNTITKNYYRYKQIKNEINKYDLLIGYTIQGGILATVFSAISGIKSIVCERQDPYQFSKIRRVVRDILYHKATGAVFQTADAQKYFSGIVKDSIVIPNFIDTESLPIPVPYEKRNNCIVTAGRLVDAKDQLVLLKAFNEIKDKAKGYKIIIYGEGPLQGVLEDYISTHNLKNDVCLYGHSMDILNDYNKSKIFVLSSKYEGYPNALLEALAMGMACISSDCPCGGPKDMIQLGQNGFLFKVGDKSELSKLLLTYINDDKLSERCSREALRIRKTNSKDVLFKCWISYINRVISE